MRINLKIDKNNFDQHLLERFFDKDELESIWDDYGDALDFNVWCGDWSGAHVSLGCDQLDKEIFSMELSRFELEEIQWAIGRALDYMYMQNRGHGDEGF
jgi:hypothetical protein